MGHHSSAGLIGPVHTTAEIAKELRVTTATVVRMIGAGVFPHAFKTGRVYRIPDADWVAYVKSIRPSQPAA